jgi:hypothetical protein
VVPPRRKDYNRYGTLLARLTPAGRYYTRWLGQISNYLPS